MTAEFDQLTRSSHYARDGVPMDTQPEGLLEVNDVNRARQGVNNVYNAIGHESRTSLGNFMAERINLHEETPAESRWVDAIHDTRSHATPAESINKECVAPLEAFDLRGIILSGQWIKNVRSAAIEQSVRNPASRDTQAIRNKAADQ